jgi:hypothetical protein
MSQVIVTPDQNLITSLAWIRWCQSCDKTMFGWNTSFWIVHSGNGMLLLTCSHALLLSFVWTKEFSFVRRLKPPSFYTIAWKVWIEGFFTFSLQENIVESWFCIHPHTLQKLSVHILSQNQLPHKVSSRVLVVVGLESEVATTPAHTFSLL